MKKLGSFKFCGVLMFLLFCIDIFPAYAYSIIPVGSTLPKFKMEVSNLQDARNYLGVQGSGEIAISDISAKLIILEFFSVFCPVCHEMAPVANNLKKLIEGDPDLKKDIKMIGIGLGNNTDQISAYVKKFGVSFPVIADPNGTILTAVRIVNVPQTLIIDQTGKVLRNHPGVIDNLDQFLLEIREIHRKQ